MLINQVKNDGYTIGIGLTDHCNSNCAHCYSRTANKPTDLDYDLICRLVDAIPIKSVNFGTGESVLYADFIKVLHYLNERNINVALTTNGISILQLTNEELRRFHDIDFSIDFADQKMNDDWRYEGAYFTVLSGAERCRKLGIEASLVTCLMKENAAYMGELAKLAIANDLSLRVNVYKSVFTREHQPTYKEFWSAIRDLTQNAFFTACSEPIVSAAIGNENQKNGNPCGRMSFRIHPDGAIVPCVYLKESKVTIENLLADFERWVEELTGMVNLPLPDVCQKCRYAQICQGGCASRRIFQGKREPDEYCFVLRDDHPEINARWKKSKGLVHEDYLCTMIFTG